MNTATSFTQRVYDLLRASPELLTVAQLCERSGFAEVSVRNALQALRDRKALITVRWWPDRAWRYGVNAIGERPRDDRGRKQLA
jgi:DNA-binding IclR family transcriptional regulator